LIKLRSNFLKFSNDMFKYADDALYKYALICKYFLEQNKLNTG